MPIRLYNTTIQSIPVTINVQGRYASTLTCPGTWYVEVADASWYTPETQSLISRGLLMPLVVEGPFVPHGYKLKAGGFYVLKNGDSLVPVGQDIGIVTSNAETSSWLARVTSNGGSISAPDVYAVDAFVTVAKSIGLTEGNSRINVFAGNDLSSALCPVFLGGGPTTDAAFGFTAGDYSRSLGLTGNASNKYLNTGVAPSSLATATSLSLGVYARSALDGHAIACRQSLSQVCGLTQRSIVSSYFDAYDFSGGRLQVSNNNGSRLLVGSRTPSGAAVYQDGSLLGSTAGSGGSVPTIPLYVFGENLNGALNDPAWAVPVGGYFVGGGMTAPNVATFSAAWQTLMTAFGRQV